MSPLADKIAYAGTPGSARAQERYATARMGTPRSPVSSIQTPRRGELAHKYESNRGTAEPMDHENTYAIASARPSKKLGVTRFTDPTKPTCRPDSKRITNVDEHRGDPYRAGGRTRNPVLIQQADKISNGKGKLIPYRYSENSIWKPSKRTVECQMETTTPTAKPHATPWRSEADHRMTPRGGEGAAAVLEPGVARRAVPALLGNYLNDMKRCAASLRTMSGQPSDFLQRQNDRRTWLSSENRHMQRSVSCDSRLQASRTTSASRASSVANAESEGEDSYGFAKKRGVSGEWTKTHSRLDLLHHSGDDGNASLRYHTPQRSCSAAPDGYGLVKGGLGASSASIATSLSVSALATPRTPRSRPEATARFDEMVAHMNKANPEQRKHFENFKTRGENSLGIFEQSPNTPRRAA